ncbi:glycosyltransferase family 39 protein (plasmid) [Roseomonas gilardii subsp. gilardii]|uniref:ArnT family glycosyltransferase n=1 Tax=Roseomonas gilardii TaxID=257708 RepID=UPI001FF75184|nr:glycosyltransferase family 39 protein [Roseomonas gilardii]UPG74647.1 glycosyltransferase family 39 protein [Roseomonas gilardii subsp. gilardii]
MLLLLAVALLARGFFFGNPVLESDEQFYLLVGDRMLQGALPYLDIWDRKPVGLFLIYAAIRALGGEGIVQYQVVATLFATATAFLVTRIGAELGSRRGGLLAGMAYLLWLGAFGGEGGQAPVFYNLFVAGAAWTALRAVAHPGLPARLTGLGAAAMLLTGLAMQVKYTAVFEGMFFGCALLWAAWRARMAAGWLFLAALAWIACALLPTAAALAAYAAMGEAWPFLFANFLSIFERNTAALGSSLPRLLAMLGLLLPLGLCALLGLRLSWRHSTMAPEIRRATGFVAGWALVAVSGVLAFGTYYNHYALPLLLPLSVAAAPLLGWPEARAWKVTAAAALLLAGAVATAVPGVLHLRSRGDGHEVRALVAAMRPGATLYVFDGEAVLYLLSHSPLPTRYAFPTHLSDLREAGGIGTDPEAELRRVLASRPDYIVTTDIARGRINPEAQRLLQETLATAYRPVRSVRIGRGHRLLYAKLP